MLRSALLVLATLLSGCVATGPVLDVEPPRTSIRGARLDVAALGDTLVVDNEGRLRREVPLGPDSTYEDLFWATFLPELQAQAAFEEVVRSPLPEGHSFAPVRVRVADHANDRIPYYATTVSLPPLGQPIRLGSEEARFLLLVERIRADRTRPTRGTPGMGMPGMPGSTMGIPGHGQDGITFKLRASLLDLRTGQLLSAREVDASARGRLWDPLGITGRSVGRRTWHAAMEELVAELLSALPIAERPRPRE